MRCCGVDGCSADKARADLNQAKLMVTKAMAYFAEEQSTDGAVFFGRFTKLVEQVAVSALPLMLLPPSVPACPPLVMCWH